MQADTIVPSPANPQDFNRYSYVRNNPLKYTDPSGHDCLIIDGDEHCGDDLPDHHFVPPVDAWSWDILSEEEQLLAYEAYLRFRENPDYYRSLYWTDSIEMAYIQLWAEYAENRDLRDFVGIIDLTGELTKELDEIERQLTSREIDDETATELKIPILLMLGITEIPDGSGDDGTWGVGGSPRVLQTGGHTIQKRTLKELGLTREQGKRAIEALKKDLGLPSNFHDSKIWSDGSVTHSHTGIELGNLFDYVD